MQMIELYAYQVGPRTKHTPLTPVQRCLVGNEWDAARADYDASPCRGKAFVTLPRHEQVEIVRKYVNR